jgi:hypothetical protein
LTPADSKACGVRAYEDLRREVLSGETLGSGSWGLALVIHRGLAAWLHALTRREDQPPCAQPQIRQVDRPAPVRMGAQMTMLLAGMILAGRREVHA